MRKVYLFMLMAVGLLISGSMWAGPERPVPPEPQAPEGVEMVKPEMPEATMPEHPTLPEKGLVKKTISKDKVFSNTSNGHHKMLPAEASAKMTPRKAPMEEGMLFSVEDAEGKVNQFGKLLSAVNAAANSGKPIVVLESADVDCSVLTISNDITFDLQGNNLTLQGITISGNVIFTNSASTDNTVTIGDYYDDLFEEYTFSRISGSITTIGGHVQIEYALYSWVFFSEEAYAISAQAPEGSVFADTDPDYPIMVADGYSAKASIGDKKYVALQYAFDAVPTDGTETTVTLLCDVTEPSYLFVNGGRNIKLDLQNNTLSFQNKTCIYVSATYENGYVPTSSDKLTVINGTLTTTYNGFMNYGTAVLTNVVINCGNYAIQNIGATANLTANSVTGTYLYCNGESTINDCNFSKNIVLQAGDIILNNCIIEGQIYLPEGSTANVTVDGKDTKVLNDAVYVYNGTCTIKDGQYGRAGLYGGTLNIEGGTFSTADNWNTIYVSNNYGTPTLNISGGTIKNTCTTSANKSRGIYVASPATITLSNCEVYGGEYGLSVDGKATIVINEGASVTCGSGWYAVYLSAQSSTFKMTGGSLIGWVYFYHYYMDINITGGLVDGSIYSYGSSISISNGTNDSKTTVPEIKANSITIYDTSYGGALTITGGKFHKNTFPLPEGYTYHNNGDGTWTVVPPVVATIGQTGYYSLEEALSKANEGDEVTLQVSTRGHRFIIDKAITLNLNGKTITNDNTGVNSSDPQPQDKAPFTICVSADGVVIKDGHLVVEYYWYYCSSNESKSSAAINIEENVKNVLLKNLTIDKGNGSYGPGWCVRICENAFAKIEDGDYRGYFTNNPVTQNQYTVRGTFKNKCIIPNEGWEYQDNGNDTYTLVTSAAKIKGKDVIYHTVTEAFADAQDNDIIYLMTTIEEDITITNNVNNLTLDIGNHDIEGKLTITGNDVKVDGFGTIDDLGGNVRIVRAYTKVNPTGYLADGSTFKSVDENLYRVYTDKVVYMDVKDKYYPTLAAALADLPENSTPATVKILLDEQFDFLNSFYTVKKYQNVTIDLNGHKIAATTGVKENSQIFKNEGTLIIDDKSADKNGIISNCAYNADTRTIPGYGSYTIYNTGTLILNNGTIENASSGGACYCVENHYNSDKVSPTFIMNGGKLVQPMSSAVRYYMNGTPYEESTNTVIINGGEIEATAYGVVVHYSNSSNIAPHIVFTMNGGKISAKNHYAFAGMATSGTGNDMSNTYITINGGTLDGSIMVNAKSGSATTRKGKENLSITGGTFLYQPAVDASNAAETFEEFITGGIFANFDSNGYEKFYSNKNKLIAEGYTAIPCTDEGFNPETDLIISTLDKKDVEVGEGEKNLGELVHDIKEDGTTEITIVPNTDEGKQTIINITEDTKVNKIEVTTDNGKGEAQIVVKDGATLNVGNGGIVSENDILTTVLVESGGTLIVGTNGIDKEGNATPIEIQASEGKGSGVLIFSPNSKAEDTKKYAEVDLYTYCKKIGDGKYTWQQFAIPVTGLTNDKVVKTPNKTSYVFEWDYATYSWSQLNNWAQLDEPFAGYDVTNVSENGGVVYTFKGDLIGNQNIQLTLPHKDYCVMGNSYTAPIDIVALFKQIEKEMKNDVIEKTVYKYNAKSGYYVFTNELEQELHKIGIVNAQFTEILPMEGFLLNLQNGNNTAGVMLNYANAVFTPAMDKANGGNQAPRMNNNTDFIIAKINISSAHATDLVTLVEGDEFSADIENGKDAFKYLNEGANLYAFDGTNKLAMVATNNLEGTMLAFQAAEDAEYTLTFDRVLNADYSLLDLLTGESIEMVEGNTYTFYATPNTLNPSRFMVVATAKAPTAVENAKVNEGAKGIYTIMGQYIGSAEMWNAMPQGVYMVNGVKVIK